MASPDRLRGDLARIAHRGGDMEAFSLDAARILARAVPFDGVCLIAMDPATLVPTREVVRNGLPDELMPRLAEIEVSGDDVNSFAWLAGSGRGAATLSAATDGDLDRSRRHREIRRPSGFGDELRAVLVDDGAIWGALTLLRAADRDNFEPADAALIGSVTRELAEGLRRSALGTALEECPDAAQGTGVVVLAPDNSIAVTNGAAEELLAELWAPRTNAAVPPVVRAVASRARAIDDDGARARVRTAAGRWLHVRGSRLGDDDSMTAVIIEPARPSELAPLIADAYGLTERERAVTELVAHGLGTNTIATRLHISPWTVQDHLKAIFEKVGVSSRGELTARFFFEQHAPRLTDASR